MKHKSLQKQLISRFYHRNRLSLLIAIFGALLFGVLNLILSWILQQLIDAASGSPGARPLGELSWICVYFLLFCAAAFLIQYWAEPRFIRRALRQYKEFAFEKLLGKSISSFQEENTASYLSSFSNDVTSIEENYLSKQLSFVQQSVMFLGSLAMMLWYSPLMTAIAAGLVLLPLLASLLSGGRLERAERQVSDRNQDFTAALKDFLTGFGVVKSFQAEQEIFQLFREKDKTLENEKFSRRQLKFLIQMLGSLAGIVSQLGIFLAGAWLALSGYGLTPGTIMVFVNLMGLITLPISELPGILAGFRASSALIGKLASSLEQNTGHSGGKELSGLSNGITIENLSFSYEQGKEVLHGVSAVLEAGKAYAVVGASGSGKSTLLNLFMGSSTAYGGKILFDGTELRELSSRSLYSLLSVIQQNVFVFDASIEENITMFRQFPTGEVQDAIRRAHLDQVLSKRGREYLCGENGKGLSGGEKQRVSIARSLLKKSAVLLADEATAALDAQTTRQVTEDLLDLENVTRVIVTHTLAEPLLRRYDGILVLRDGQIEETGTFEELMEKRGYFYALYMVSQ